MLCSLEKNKIYFRMTSVTNLLSALIVIFFFFFFFYTKTFPFLSTYSICFVAWFNCSFQNGEIARLERGRGGYLNSEHFFERLCLKPQK